MSSLSTTPNPARAMGLLDEPRYALDHVSTTGGNAREHHSREDLCLSGTALNTDEIMEIRMRSGLPRRMPSYVHDKMNTLACMRDRQGYPDDPHELLGCLKCKWPVMSLSATHW